MYLVWALRPSILNTAILRYYNTTVVVVVVVVIITITLRIEQIMLGVI